MRVIATTFVRMRVIASTFVRMRVRLFVEDVFHGLLVHLGSGERGRIDENVFISAITANVPHVDSTVLLAYGSTSISEQKYYR